MSSDAAGANGDVARDVVVMAAFDIDPAWRLWGWSRLVRGQSGLRGAAGLRFAKVLGSGVEGGFGLKPSASILGLFCVFQDAASADAFTANDGLMRRWQDRSRESFCVKMQVYSCRGSWAGNRLAVTATPPPGRTGGLADSRINQALPRCRILADAATSRAIPRAGHRLPACDRRG